MNSYDFFIYEFICFMNSYMNSGVPRFQMWYITNWMCYVPCFVTCYIAVWKINVIHNIIVWMCYTACYIWFKSGALPPPPQCAYARICSKLKVYLLLIRNLELTFPQMLQSLWTTKECLGIARCGSIKQTKLTCSLLIVPASSCRLESSTTTSFANLVSRSRWSKTL